MSPQKSVYQKVIKSVGPFAHTIVEHGDFKFTAYFDTTAGADIAWAATGRCGGRVAANWDGEYEINVAVR